MRSDLKATVSRNLLLWKDRLESHWQRLDISHDLAENIGSARWFKSFGTMVTLGVVALSFWPDFSAVEAAAAIPGDASTRDEFRSQMILPLSQGSDSGRHMGATAMVVPIANAPERPTIRLVARLGEGDSFARMLQRAGVSAGDAARASELVASKVALGEIDPGTRFDVTLGRRSAPGEPRPLDKLAFRARFDLDLSLARRGGELTMAAHPIAVDTTPLRITGTVGSSLYRSARAAGAPARAVQLYLQTLDGHVSLEDDVAATDKFDFVVAYKRSATGESETGQLLYAGLERGGKPIAQLVRWGSDGQFFDAAEAASPVTRVSSIGAPVAGRITSGFGMRFHPILRYARMHSGVDFGAAWGSPIHAASDGVVSYAGRHGGHGNYVRIEHGGGLATGYAHMSRFAVSPGTRVQAGQIIGYVGSTGLSTGPHLHFEAYRAGRTINPLSVKFAMRTAQVDAKQLNQFKARLAQLKAIKPGAALKSLGPKQAAPK
ncbi:MAG: M23 family metallopeptidase [Novosphingobium sp.]